MRVSQAVDHNFDLVRAHAEAVRLGSTDATRAGDRNHHHGHRAGRLDGMAISEMTSRARSGELGHSTTRRHLLLQTVRGSHSPRRFDGVESGPARIFHSHIRITKCGNLTNDVTALAFPLFA